MFKSPPSEKTTKDKKLISKENSAIKHITVEKFTRQSASIGRRGLNVLNSFIVDILKINPSGIEKEKQLG